MQEQTIILSIVIHSVIYSSVLAQDIACSAAFVPCPPLDGFQFFNKTCYAVIRDPAKFGAGDADLKCQTGLQLAFSSALAPGGRLDTAQRGGLHVRTTMARVTSRGSLRTLTSLLQQVVEQPSELTLVGLACSHDCDRPAAWISPTAAADLDGGVCSSWPMCNWLTSAQSAWSPPPGVRAAGQPLANRLGVLSRPRAAGRLAVMTDGPQTLLFNSVACELSYRTTEAGSKRVLEMGVEIEGDSSLYIQMVRELTVRAVNATAVRVELSWRPPACAVDSFYVTSRADGLESENRTVVSAASVCRSDRVCRLEMELPPCSLLYILVGSILKGEDTAPSVVQWETPPPEDPPTPSAFNISDISGSAVTIQWKSDWATGPCRPYHMISMAGHGDITVDPGVTRIIALLGSHCVKFNVSVQATMMGRRSGVGGPIHGVTGPAAPDISTPDNASNSVQVRMTGTTWTLLHWSRADSSASSCLLANYRVKCQTVPRRGPAFLMTSSEGHLNVTGLTPGTKYSCAVCVLANATTSELTDADLAAAPCGELRVVELRTAETISGPPSGLRASEVFHDSFTLIWERPRHPNGVILRYTISTSCEEQTFPLCPADSLCQRRSWTLQLAGNDTEHVTYKVEVVQAARRYNVTVAAVTAAGQGHFCPSIQLETTPGVPSAPRRVLVTPLVRTAVGRPEQTSITVSLQPPCPYPGPHRYRLQLEHVDFIPSYGSTVRSSSLSRADIEQLYAGLRNISFSVFDGKWTPGFQYRVRVAAVSENDGLTPPAQTASQTVNFTMVVPPPGPVRGLSADCSVPMRLKFSWTNPTRHAFGIVRYCGRYRCRQPSSGRQVSGLYGCHWSRCPCASSLRLSDQCRACERVCNYPVKSIAIDGGRKFYFNCSCLHQVADVIVAPGSLCRVSVRAVSQYQRTLGKVTVASCRSPQYIPRISDLRVSSHGDNIDVSWSVPRPLEVPTDAYHVTILRNHSDGRIETAFQETINSSQCYPVRCVHRWRPVVGEAHYQLLVSAQSVHAVPSVGPAVQAIFSTPPRRPRLSVGNMTQLAAQLTGGGQQGGPAESRCGGSARRCLADPSRQLHISLPPSLYDRTTGVLREIRIIVSDASRNNTSEQNVTLATLPTAGDLRELPNFASWHDFVAGRRKRYQASPPGFMPIENGSEWSDFVLGENLTCRSTPEEGESFCNGPLRPDAEYHVRLVFVNAAGFVVSPPVTFRMSGNISEAARARYVDRWPGPADSQQEIDSRTPGSQGAGSAPGRSTSDGGGADGGADASGTTDRSAGSVTTAVTTARVHSGHQAVWVYVIVSLALLIGLLSCCIMVWCMRRYFRDTQSS